MLLWHCVSVLLTLMYHAVKAGSNFVYMLMGSIKASTLNCQFKSSQSLCPIFLSKHPRCLITVWNQLSGSLAKGCKLRLSPTESNFYKPYWFIVMLRYPAAPFNAILHMELKLRVNPMFDFKGCLFSCEIDVYFCLHFCISAFCVHIDSHLLCVSTRQ